MNEASSKNSEKMHLDQQNQKFANAFKMEKRARLREFVANLLKAHTRPHCDWPTALCITTTTLLRCAMHCRLHYNFLVVVGAPWTERCSVK